MFKDLLIETMRSLSGNKVRSGLTALGIIIGIASVISLVAIGQGAQNSIAKNIEAIGSNLIMVSPGSQRIGGISQGGGSAQSLTTSDADAIRNQVSGISAVAPSVTRNYQLTAKGMNTNTQVIGTTGDYLMVRNVVIDSGSFFNDQQIRGSAKVTVLGPTTGEDLFGIGVDPLGKIVRINNMDFTVVGVTVAKGGSGFNNQDDVAYVPLTTAQHYLSGDEYLSSISIAAADQISMASVQQEVSDLLLMRHKISDLALADFNIMNQNDIIATATSITGTFTTLLSAIAGISLLVGGIGIMNMMLTTVTERTREIGLRKAVGIRKIYINLQFLAEAAVLTFLGGLFGIFVGWLASMVLSSFVNVDAQVSTSSIFLAFGVSAGVGIIFGFYPARKAAAMNPIDALRYE